MAYIRAKRQGKYTYYWLVEGYREDGKVKQRTLRYLGKNKPSQVEITNILRDIKGKWIS